MAMINIIIDTEVATIDFPDIPVSGNQATN